ncbi:MAG: hypothetical protein SPD11_00525 [Sphaerochaetaceae bacterium]|nr:hypothetical protein [Sphaerochaetaceae bacterium]
METTGEAIVPPAGCSLPDNVGGGEDMHGIGRTSETSAMPKLAFSLGYAKFKQHLVHFYVQGENKNSFLCIFP